MLRPVIAVVGRPNVGKSTLFNRIAQTKKSIVHGMPGVTRDINYTEVKLNHSSCTLVDTGGFDPSGMGSFSSEIGERLQGIIAEADLFLFVMDGREGLLYADLELAAMLRKNSKPIIHLVNKVDPGVSWIRHSDFHRLGADTILFISSAHGIGIMELTEEIESFIETSFHKVLSDRSDFVRVALVGRPNVGKSSMVNRIIGYERVIVSSIPGTTTDAVDTYFKYDGRGYLLIDTAGIRRRSRISGKVEVFSVAKAISMIRESDVTVMMINAVDGLTTQDMKIAHVIADNWKPCLVLVNKWDLIKSKVTGITEDYHKEIKARLSFLSYASILFVSAETGQRASKIFDIVGHLFEQSHKRVSTSAVNRAISSAVGRHSPPIYKGKRVRIRYATQTGVAPPSFTAFVNYPEGIDSSYRRYLAAHMRGVLQIHDSPLRLIFRKN